MKSFVIGALFILATSASSLVRGEELTKATFAITGLHCPPCTRTVQSSLTRQDGIKSIKVDWKTKSAKIEFDKEKVSAQKLARLIAATPHMMGGDMQYGGQLALSAPQVTDEESATKAKAALSKIEGIASAAAFPTTHTVTVRFAEKGSVCSQQLIDALKQAGFEARTY